MGRDQKILFIIIFFFPLTAVIAVERISVSSAAVQANYHSDTPSLSTDGRYVAFMSWATNLVLGDTNLDADIFIRDRQAGITERVSVDSTGGQANDVSLYPSISADGRFIAFESSTSNLVLADSNMAADIFVHDRQTGVTKRVSLGAGGIQSNADSHKPFISADGRFIAFESYASNLVVGDTNGKQDIFIHNLQTGVTERVSVNSSGAQANRDVHTLAISEDGRFVAFVSWASNLVAHDSNNVEDIFVHDRQTGVTERVSVNSAGEQANDYSYGLSISADGRFIAFASYASNLVEDDNNFENDIFVHDRQTGLTERVSVDSTGEQANESSYTPSISADGNLVAFISYASNLVANDSNDKQDTFVHNRQTGETERVSINGSSIEGDSFSDTPTISGDGRFVAFSSAADNLVGNDNNNVIDIFIYDRLTKTAVTEAIPMINLAFLIGLIGLVSGAALLVCGRARRKLPSGSCPLP